MNFSVKQLVKPLLFAAMAVTVAAPLAAHEQPGGMGGPGGGFGGGGQRGNQMRNSPKGRLSRLIGGIAMLEKEKKAPLNAAQAKRIVTAIKPWRTRKTMSDDQAKSLYMSVNNVLTSKQKNELDRVAAKGRRFGGERPEGQRGMGGPGGAPDPQRMQQMRAMMEKMRSIRKTMNPFYPPTGYAELKSAPERMREGMTRRYQRQNAVLAALAKKGGVKW
jgi:hypothetical protein